MRSSVLTTLLGGGGTGAGTSGALQGGGGGGSAPVFFDPATAQVGDIINQNGFVQTYYDDFRDPTDFSYASAIQNQNAKYKANLFFDPQDPTVPGGIVYGGPRTLYESQGVFSDPLYNGVDPCKITPTGLEITAAVSANPSSVYNGGLPYTTGLISTEPGKIGYSLSRPRGFAQRFGFWECRCKWDAIKGLFPAFWMWSSDDNLGLAREIDVLEAWGNINNQVSHGYHRHNDAVDYTNENVNVATDVHANLHTYQLYWSDNYLIWAIDGVINQIVSGHGIDDPMYFLINLAVNTSWRGDTVDGTSVFPAKMYVDFVRVSQIPNISAPPPPPPANDPGPFPPTPNLGTDLIVNNPGQAAPSNHEFFSTVGGIYGGFYVDHCQLSVGTAKGGLPVPCRVTGVSHTYQGLGYYGQKADNSTLCDVSKTYRGQIDFDFSTSPWFTLAIDIGGSARREVTVYPDNSWKYGFGTDNTMGLIPIWIGPNPVTGAMSFVFDWTPQPDSGNTSTTLDLRIGPGVNDPSLSSIIYKMSLRPKLAPAVAPTWTTLGISTLTYQEKLGAGSIVAQFSNITPGGTLLQLTDSDGNRLAVDSQYRLVINSTTTVLADSPVVVTVKQSLNGFDSPTQSFSFTITAQPTGTITPTRYMNPAAYDTTGHGVTSTSSWPFVAAAGLASDQPLFGTQSLFDTWPAGQAKPKLIAYQDSFSRFPTLCTKAFRRLEEYWGYRANGIQAFLGKADWSSFQNTSVFLDDWRYQLPIDPNNPTVGSYDQYEEYIIAVPLTTSGTPIATVANNGNVLFMGTQQPAKNPFNNLFQHMLGRGMRNPILRIGWEFNGGWQPWTPSATTANDWIKAYRNIVQWARDARVTSGGVSVGFDSVRTIWCTAAQANVAFGSKSPASCYPGDDVVDYIGVDEYNIESNTSWPNWADLDTSLLTDQQLTDRFNYNVLGSDPTGVGHGYSTALAWTKWFAEYTNGLVANTAAGTVIYKNQRKPLAIPEFGTGWKSGTYTNPITHLNESTYIGGEDDGIYWTKMLDFIFNPANNVALFMPWEMPASDYYCRTRAGSYWTQTTPSNSHDEKPKSFAAMTNGGLRRA